MTRAEIENVLNALAEIIDGWNDAAADEDRGRRNDALCLTVFDDGSGRLGRRCWTYSDKPGEPDMDVEDWHDFDDADGLVKLLLDQGIEFEDKS